MRVLAIDEQGKHHIRDIAHIVVASGSFREPEARKTCWVSGPVEDPTYVDYRVREYIHRGNLFDGTPVMVASPWTVKEARAADICTNHPDHISLSESLVRDHVYRLCDTAGEWHKIDDRMRVRVFSENMQLREVEYRLLVQVRTPTC